MDDKKCLYCQVGPPIKNSHIIPAYIFEWIKKTSHTGFLRRSDRPNTRVQDGIKKPILCDECEKKFSLFENEFKKTIFLKVANYKKPPPNILQVNKKIRSFIYSIAWRVLADFFHFERGHDLTKEEFDKIPFFLKKLSESVDIGNGVSGISAYLVPITDCSIKNLSLQDADRYLLERQVIAEPRIWALDERFIVFIKIPFFIIVVNLIHVSSSEWSCAGVDDVEFIEVNKINKIPSYVRNLIFRCEKITNDTINKTSINQLELIKRGMESADPACGAEISLRRRYRSGK